MNSTKNYFADSKALAEFVIDMPTNSKPDWPWIMTITPVLSGGFYALIATDASLDDTELQTAKFFSTTQVNT